MRTIASREIYDFEMSFSSGIYGEEYRGKIASLSKKKGNHVCSECGEFDPEWASIDQGVFVCINCSGVFRSFSRVKSVALDGWTNKEIEAMSESGNNEVKKRLEVSVPDCWLKPYPGCNEVIRREWILAKYSKKQFTGDGISPSYLRGIKEGWLFKLRKQGSKWQQRWFVLDGKSLKFYHQLQDSAPKHNIPIERINVTLEVAVDKSNSMQIMARMNGQTRNIFIHAESGTDIMEWFCAIRAAKQKVLQERHPDWDSDKIKENLSNDFIKCGYMQKTPAGTIKFQKRWFTLESDRLSYYENVLDAHPLGEIMLGSTVEGFSIEESIGVGEFGFALHTPKRVYPLLPVPENRVEKEEWMTSLQQIIHQPPVSPSSPSMRCSTYELDV